MSTPKQEEMNVLWVCLYTSARYALVLAYTGVDVFVYSWLKGFARAPLLGMSVNDVHALLFFMYVQNRAAYQSPCNGRWEQNMGEGDEMKQRK